MSLWLAQVTPEPLASPAIPCIGCRVDVEQLRSGFSATTWQSMQRGEVVTTKTKSAAADGNVETHVECSAILPFAVPQVWQVLIDFEGRPKFIPSAKKISILRTEGNRVWCSEHLRFFLVSIDFQAINTLDPELGTIAWILDKSAPHDIADTNGSWQIAPLSNMQTLVRYRAWVDTGRPVPRFIQDALSERSLPKMVTGLREELGRRFPR